MIGGDEGQNRVGVLTKDPGRSGRHGRRRISSLGLQQGMSDHADLGQLLDDRVSMVHAADDDQTPTALFRQRRDAQGRFLKQGPVSGERHKLLGSRGAGRRPQPGSSAAAHDHGIERHAPF